MRGRLKKNLESILLRELPRRRWFDHRSKSIDAIQITEAIPLGKSGDRQSRRLAPAASRCSHRGARSLYLLPLGIAWKGDAQHFLTSTDSVLAQLQSVSNKESGVLFDASIDPPRQCCFSS